jgi:hypothetical protein
VEIYQRKSNGPPPGISDTIDARSIKATMETFTSYIGVDRRVKRNNERTDELEEELCGDRRIGTVVTIDVNY